MNTKRARTGNVVIRSLVSTQIACVLTAIAPQLVNTLNSLTISTFLGVDCFKAISAFNPISGMILLLISTACLGPSIQAGKAYGELNLRTADRLFTLAGIMAAAALWGGNHLWLGFPSTSIVLASYVAIVSSICRRRDRNLIPYFLFNKLGDVVNLDISVNCSPDNFQEAMARIRKFLGICEVGDVLAGKIEICCEELMQNISAKKAKRSTFDLRLSDLEDSVSIAIKNVGAPLSPVINNDIVNEFRKKGRIPDGKEISLLCIRQCSSKVVYRYVYGMNVAYLLFNKNNPTFVDIFAK